MNAKVLYNTSDRLNTTCDDQRVHSGYDITTLFRNSTSYKLVIIKEGIKIPSKNISS